jgi:hypothetical protein
MALPTVVNSNNNRIITKITQLKSIINNTMPATIGITETRISGSISFKVGCIRLNSCESPFLKNRQTSLPLPKAQALP